MVADRRLKFESWGRREEERRTVEDPMSCGGDRQRCLAETVKGTRCREGGGAAARVGTKMKGELSV